MVPALRIRLLNAAPIRAERPIVLYWMTAFRRTRSNFALERAVEHAEALNRPLVILEALRVGYPWASDRLHQFVIDGMRDNAATLSGLPGVTYHAYLEPAAGEGRGLLETLAQSAAVVVTDDFPCFFLPRMASAAAARLDVQVESVDGNGLLPLRAVEQVYPTAYAFRRTLQKTLPAHFSDRPAADPVARLAPMRAWPLPAEVTRRWPHAIHWLDGGGTISQLPIDHTVGVAPTQGGAGAAARRLRSFLDHDLALYGTGRNEPDNDVSSRLSPYLHFGHIGAHEVFDEVMRREGWLGQVSARTAGQREGWWQVSPHAESFLDEFITWRELGYNFTSRRDDYDRYESLPAWAQASLDEHSTDPRPYVYSLDQLTRAETHDPLWNAAQRQLTRDGRIHNYLRMLWGKKILQWSASPREALAHMIELNNRYALDGRNPNSYSGIFWVLGRYDRPWGPTRPIFGVIRYMTSENTARKVSVTRYLARYGATPELFS